MCGLAMMKILWMSEIHVAVNDKVNDLIVLRHFGLRYRDLTCIMAN